MSDKLDKKVKGLFTELFAVKKKVPYGAPELAGEDAKNFEAVLALQDDIIRCFGFNPSFDHESFLDSVKEGEEAKWIEWMKGEAEAYLKGPTKTHKAILTDAQKCDEDSDMVLREFDLPHHVYTDFVYDEMLLKQKASVEDVLHDFKLLMEDRKALSSLGMFALQNSSRKDREYLTKLETKGLNYLNEFHVYVLKNVRPKRFKLFPELKEDD